MRKISLIIIGVGIIFLSFCLLSNHRKEIEDDKNIEQYIEQTSIPESIQEEQVEEKPINTTTNSIKYKAIIEIPKINMKKGLVESTDNFKSINYAISIDSHSKYPNEIGNFILYAHSGSSSISYFKNVYKLEINDIIYIYHDGYKYKYEIFNKYDVDKTGKVQIVKSESDKYITLITCSQTDKTKQIVIMGKQIEMGEY